MTNSRRTTTDARDKGKGKLIEVPSIDNRRSTSVKAHVDQTFEKMHSTSNVTQVEKSFQAVTTSVSAQVVERPLPAVKKIVFTKPSMPEQPVKATSLNEIM